MMTEAKNVDQLQAYANVNGYTVDYSYWEDASANRTEAKKDFKDNKIYAPDFQYPKIDQPLLFPVIDYDSEDQTLLSDKKTLVLEAIYELEANRKLGEWSDARCAFYADYQEAQLKKILLVESASRLNDESLSSQQQLVARQEFMALNEECFGEYDIQTFGGMMHTELERVDRFTPADETATSIKRYLEKTFDQKSFTEPEQDLIEPELLASIKETVISRYAPILEAVPSTDASVVYEVVECVDIMNDALMATDLYDAGWRAEEAASKTAPSTNSEKKRIYLPSNTRRTADELKRLIIHEQEVHARRGQNGELTGEKPLASGTAAYADVEEGLGVILECALAGSIDNPSYHRARDRYIVAGLALGADGQPRDARQTYEIAWRLFATRMASDGRITEEVVNKAKSQAITHIENAFRATNSAMRGVIYTKLKVYYEGLAKNVRYFQEYRGTIDEALDAAMIGKCDHTDEQEMDNIHNLMQERAA